MKNKFLKHGYGLMAALVLTILVAGPFAHATQASGELMKPNGECEFAFCVR